MEEQMEEQMDEQMEENKWKKCLNPNLEYQRSLSRQVQSIGHYAEPHC